MTDYTALVGRQTTDFKTLFAPGSEMLAASDGVVTLAGQCGDSTNLLWRVWIPQGARCLQATMYAYYGAPACKVLMRMGKPPVGGLDSVTPENAAAVDLRNVLASLLAGAEVPCYTPVEGGAIKLSDGSMDSPVVGTTWGWLYIKALQMPGQKVYQLDVRVTADEAQYTRWFANAVWDEQGNPLQGVQAPVPEPAPVDEQWVFGRVKEEGLIAPLAKLCKAKDDAELIQAAKATGLWAALLKFTK